MKFSRAARRRRARERVRSLPPVARAESGHRDESYDGLAGMRHALRELSAERGEWAGIPVPLEGERLVLEPSYPYAGLANLPTRSEPAETDEYAGWKVRQSFWSTFRRSTIHILEKPDGRITASLTPGIHHLEHDLRTLGCSDAWGIAQESRAVELLQTLIRRRAFRQYMMTGLFLESSRRSGVTYLFRRLKPTVAMSGRTGKMKILAVLCLHPIGYYEGSWAGAMTPTDDVIAHLSLMRGDEPLYWRRANHIPAYRPEAGL